MDDISDASRRHQTLHLLNRLAFGPRPGDVERVNALGPDKYIREQLHPESIPIPPNLTSRIDDFRTLTMSPVALFAEYERPIRDAAKSARAQADGNIELRDATRDARMHARIVMREAVEARLMRAIYGTRQLQEVMTAFWFNHFNVFAGKGLDSVWTGSFEEEAIRPHTMGKFRTLLGATARHPAMLFYLDNWLNTAPGSPGARGRFEGINENYARELMELHTLGVNGGYSQQDVIALAHILTGWGIPRPRDENESSESMPPVEGQRQRLMRRMRRRARQFEPADPSGFYFDSQRHDFSAKTFLNHGIPGGGAAQVEQALDILALHPSTASHLSFQLAQYFVADDPPEPLVTKMAQKYLATGGDIRAVLETMFLSAEFRDPANYGAKFKTPYEYVISSARATGVTINNYRPLYGTMQLLGMPTYGCLTPNGYASTQDAWLNPDSMMIRLSFATAIGSGRLPLDHQPDDDEANGGPPVVTKNPNRKIKLLMNDDSDRPGRQRMTPPDPNTVAAALGGYFSKSTTDAISAAPAQLSTALLLGSPDFMKR